MKYCAVEIIAMFSFIYYNEEKDEEYSLELSQDVIDFIYNNGWKLIEKIGQGSVCAAYEALNLKTNQHDVVLIPGNDNTESNKDNLENIRNLQQTGNLSTNYMIKVYDSLYWPHRYTNDLRCRSKGGSYIQIVQKADKTVAEHLYDLYVKDVYNDKVAFAVKFYHRLVDILTYLNSKGLDYYDLIWDNMGMINDEIVLLDLESIVQTNPDKNIPDRNIPKEVRERTIYLFSIFDGESLSEIREHKWWKFVDGMSKDDVEQERGIEDFYLYL